MQETELLKRLRRDDEDALREIVFAYGAYVSAVVRNTGGGRLAVADIEELASTAFFALWQNAARLRGQNLKAWLARTARNACIDFLRRQRDALPLEESMFADGAADPEALAIWHMEEEAVRDALARLRPAEREVLTRYYMHNQRVAQIARALGVTESAVKQRLARGRENLRRELTNP
ncbi:MAG: sigma-70 family RNA polymerase sigma factor [Clostridiales bacterium]|nr:sigma-70 family RNA polymerase sigma factor [Clostridiales bacterium]